MRDRTTRKEENLMKWIKTCKTVKVGSGTTITYRLEGTPYTVESRKRPIPHANGVGTWDHTSYFVLKDGVEVIQQHTLRAAQACAEDLYNRDQEGGEHHDTERPVAGERK